MPPLVLLTAVAGLNARPPELTGGDQAAYSAKRAEYATALAAQAQGGPRVSAQVASVAGEALSAADLASNGVKPPAAGGVAWAERLRVEGCGRSTGVRLIVAKLPQGWGAVALPPGTSVVGLRLSKDVMVAAVAAAFSASPNSPARRTSASAPCASPTRRC